MDITLLLEGLMIFLRGKSVIYKTKIAKINTTYKLIFFIKNLERAIAPKPMSGSIPGLSITHKTKRERETSEHIALNIAT